MNEVEIRSILNKCWSMKSSSFWTADNHSKGQCGVTALIIQDIFGGEILKTILKDGKIHYYNKIGESRYDFTAEQFNELILYKDLPTNKDELIAEITIEQYEYLFNMFNKALNYNRELLKNENNN